MRQFDEVRELRRLFATPDYFARIAVADLGAYESFLTQHVMTLAGVERVTSHFTMETIKEPH